MTQNASLTSRRRNRGITFSARDAVSVNRHQTKISRKSYLFLYCWRLMLVNLSEFINQYVWICCLICFMIFTEMILYSCSMSMIWFTALFVLIYRVQKQFVQQLFLYSAPYCQRNYAANDKNLIRLINLNWFHVVHKWCEIWKRLG